MRHTFPEIIIDIKTKSKTSLLICAAMLAAGAILLLASHTVGWLFLCMGLVLAYSLYSKRTRMDRELSCIDDMDGFCAQFASDESAYMELLGLTITRDYAVLTLPYLQIFRLADMEKFEVGIQGDIRKALFLTDRAGKRHRIAETQKGDALQEEFDKAYEAVRKYFASRDGE